MPVAYVNRRRDTYFLHAGTTKTGKPRYWFSMKAEGDLADSIPEGYEVYENPGSQVFLRRLVPQLVTPDEVAVVEDGLERFAPDQNCIVDVQKEHIVVYHAERITLDLEDFGLGIRPLPVRYRDYMKVIRFTLSDEQARTFRVQRWCFRGSIDRWIDLWTSGSEGKLPELVERSIPRFDVQSKDEDSLGTCRVPHVLGAPLTDDLPPVAEVEHEDQGGAAPR